MPELVKERLKEANEETSAPSVWAGFHAPNTVTYYWIIDTLGLLTNVKLKHETE